MDTQPGMPLHLRSAPAATPSPPQAPLGAAVLAGAMAALRDELLMFQERLWRQDFGFALLCLMGLEENPLASAASVAVDLTGMEIWEPGQ